MECISEGRLGELSKYSAEAQLSAKYKCQPERAGFWKYPFSSSHSTERVESHSSGKSNHATEGEGGILSIHRNRHSDEREEGEGQMGSSQRKEADLQPWMAQAFRADLSKNVQSFP